MALTPPPSAPLATGNFLSAPQSPCLQTWGGPAGFQVGAPSSGPTEAACQGDPHMALGVSPRILCAQAGPPGGAGEISQHPTTRVCGGGVCVGAEAMAAALASHVASEMKTTAVQCPKTRATSQEARGSGARACPATRPTAAVRDGCPRFPFWNSRRHANSSAGRGRGGTQAARARGGRLGRCVWELGIMRPSTGSNLTAAHQKNGRTRRRHRAVPEPRPQAQPAGASARPPRVRPARRGRAPRREGRGVGRAAAA